jgi:hypothetical protein
MSRLLAGCRSEPLDEARSPSAGAACGAVGSSDVVDASVIVAAAARGDPVVTSDVRDLRRLRDWPRVDVRLQRI